MMNHTSETSCRPRGRGLDLKSIGFVKYLLVFDQKSLVLLSNYCFFYEKHWFSLMKIGFWLKNQFLLK